MSSRIRFDVTSLLLTGTALLTMAALPFAAHASPLNGPLVVAQAPAPAADDKDKKPPPPAAAPPAAAPAKPQPPAPPAPPQARPQLPAAPPHVQAPPPPAPARPAQSAQPQQAPAAPPPKAEERRPAPAAQERREEQRGPRREDRANDRRPAQPPQAPAAQQQPTPAPAAPSTGQQPARPAPPATAQERRDDRRGGQRREGQRDGRPPAPPATATPQPAPVAPSTAQQPPASAAPPTAQQPQQRTAPATAQQPVAPAAPAVQNASPAVVAPPTQARNANEFIRRDGQASTRGIAEVRQERQESREGNRTFIREGDRTIVREGDRTIIRHNESSRFAIAARNIHTERRGANTETIVERGNGIRIVTVTDADGRLLRRYRRDQGGRDVILIDNSYAGRGANVFILLPPPVIRIPRERYILEADRARPEDIYQVFMEPPVEQIDQPYTLDQVRFSAPLRDRMPRVDLDVTFETGSWQLSPEQVDRLAAIAEGINRAIQRNPREVFMVEGHTDAVGADVDNLSLSDRRAESIAVALTEQFQVPAENLVTQGYGEQYLKVPSQGPERANRRVAVRRITPLIDQQADNTPPAR